jgi:hypothetical protein
MREGDMTFPPFEPSNWFWIVTGNEDRLWSSATGAYVDIAPEGAGVTRIASEAELAAVLAAYGLAGPVPFVPERVSARRFRLQLRISGLLDQVKAWVTSQGPLVQDAFEYSGEFVRSEPMMAAGFAELGFSPDQVDAFFVAASKL